MAGTTDDTGKKLPKIDFTQDRDSMEDIGNQLVNVEHIQQVIKQHIQRSHIDEDDEAAVELRSLVPRLDGLQSSLRKAFDVHSRRLIRKLHIFHLPDELLMKIFEAAKAHFDSMLAMGWHARDVFGPEPIRNLRLTCRRFCNASSHLLLESLDVSLTSSSLERLDEVSRHPAIPKGIRSLRIHVALCRPAPASNLQDFIDQVFELLQEENETSFDRMNGLLALSTNSWGSTHSSGEVHAGLRENIQKIQIRNEVLRSCTNYLRYGVFKQDQDQHMATLCQVFSQYSQRHDDQTAVLQDNTFARHVVEAAARMPKLTELQITDWESCELLPLPTEFNNPVYDSVRHNLLLEPGEYPFAVDWMPTGKPSKLLYQLPETFFQAGVPLTQLKISLGSVREHDLGFSEAQAEDVVTAAGNLESLEFDYRFSMRELHSNSPPGSQICSSRFGSLLLNSTNLKSVTICFDGWAGTPSMGMDAGPLLASLPWAGLKRFDLRSACIHGDKLSEHLEKLSPGTYICLGGVHLLTGFWVDLLDVIRAKADCNSSVTNARSSQDEDLGSIFRYAWDNQSPNPANLYIRGEVSKNPLRSPPAQDETGDDDTNQDYLNGG